MQRYKVNKNKIRNYWNNKLPQLWYSKKRAGKNYFKEIISKRYTVYYRYLPQVAEFDQHKNERVLEVGCGIGTDLLQYARNGARVVGIDLAPSAVAYSKSLFREFKLKGKFLVADAEKLPFENESFDLVFSFGVIHHTPSPQKAIDEIYRVLKPSKKAIIMLYAPGWNHCLVRLFWAGIIKGELLKMSYQECINKNSEVYGQSPLTLVFSKKQLKKLFCKFGKVEIKRYRFLPLLDTSHYIVGKWPALLRKFINVFVLLSEKIKVERFIGENWIIKANK